MKSLTSKLINEKLKKGWTATDFATYLEITEEKFEKLIKQTFSSNFYTKIHYALQTNQKRAAKGLQQPYKKSNQKTDRDAKGVISGVKICSPFPPLPLSSADENDDSKADVIVSEEKIAPTFSPTLTTQTSSKKLESDGSLPNSFSSLSLDELQLKKQELSEFLIISEKSRDELFDKKKQINTKIENAKKEIQKLNAEILEAEGVLTSLNQEINDVCIKINSCKKDLGCVKRNIHEMQKLCIFVYNSGEFECETKSPVEIPEWQEWYNKIISDEQLESLTVKEIKNLAKVISFTKMLDTQKRTYEIFFENPIVEEYFNQI